MEKYFVLNSKGNILFLWYYKMWLFLSSALFYIFSSGYFFRNCGDAAVFFRSEISSIFRRIDTKRHVSAHRASRRFLRSSLYRSNIYGVRFFRCSHDLTLSHQDSVYAYEVFEHPLSSAFIPAREAIFFPREFFSYSVVYRAKATHHVRRVNACQQRRDRTKNSLMNGENSGKRKKKKQDEKVRKNNGRNSRLMTRCKKPLVDYSALRCEIRRPCLT